MKKVTLKACAILACMISPTVLAEEGKVVQPTATADMAKIPWLKNTMRRENRVWQTKYDSSKPKQAYQSRVVAYAGKWARHGYGGHGGAGCAWRYSVGPLVSTTLGWKEQGLLITDKYDVDGDGDTKDDFMFSYPFSMEVPMSILDWPAASVFPERLSSTFYGGMTWYCGNNEPTALKNFSGEMGVNADHAGSWRDGRAEDHPINGYVNQKIPGSFIKHYMI